MTQDDENFVLYGSDDEDDNDADDDNNDTDNTDDNDNENDKDSALNVRKGRCSEQLC